MQKRFGIPLLTLLMWLTLTPTSRPCSICSGGGFGQRVTLRERLVECPAVVRGQLKNARFDPDGTGGGSTEFHFTTIFKTDKAITGLKQTTLSRYYPIVGNTSPDYLVFFDTATGKPDAIGGQACTDALAEYLTAIGKLDPKDSTKRLAFFFCHLAASDPAIAEDAFVEFAKATDAELTAARATFDLKLLTSWLTNPKLPPDRVGVYALLLGLCGGPEQAHVFADLLKRDTADASASSLAGVLAGYNLLNAKAGWASTRSILADTKQSYARRLSALTAVRYFQANRQVETKVDLLATYRILLAGDMADLAISDLRRFGWWDLTADVVPLYALPGQTRLMKRLVLRYAVSSPDERAVRFVTALRASEPSLIADVEAYLKETEPPKK